MTEVYGIDAMVDAIAEDLQSNPDNPQSVREISKKAVRAVLKANNELIVGAVADGHKVTYIGFGTFESRDRAERKGRNPQTGEPLTIDAATVPAFKPGKGFKDAVK
jgi:nucleoid DNA-binding protein